MVGAGGFFTGNTGEVIWDIEYTDAPGGPLAKIFGVVRGSIPGLEIQGVPEKTLRFFILAFY